MSVMFGGHAPYTEREARGFRVLHPGIFGPKGPETFKELSWLAPPSVLGIRITGANGAVIRIGRKAHQFVPFDCQIVGVRLIGDQAGSIVFDIYRATFATFPPTPANTLTPLAIGRPTLTNQQTRQDFALYGWNTTLKAGDLLTYRVLSAAVLTSITLSLIVQRNNQP